MKTKPRLNTRRSAIAKPASALVDCRAILPVLGKRGLTAFVRSKPAKWILDWRENYINTDYYLGAPSFCRKVKRWLARQAK